MSDEHKVDWTTPEAREWLVEWCCFQETGIYIESYPFSPGFGSYVVYGTDRQFDPQNMYANDLDSFSAASIASALEALPQLLGYIEELEADTSKFDAECTRLESIQRQQAAEIKRLKAELADAKSDIAALHGGSEAI